MKYYALRRVTGEYTLEQERDDGTIFRQIVGRDTINPKLRVKLDANPGVRVDAMA